MEDTAIAMKIEYDFMSRIQYWSKTQKVSDGAKSAGAEISVWSDELKGVIFKITKE